MTCGGYGTDSTLGIGCIGGSGSAGNSGSVGIGCTGQEGCIGLVDFDCGIGVGCWLDYIGSGFGRQDWGFGFGVDFDGGVVHTRGWDLVLESFGSEVAGSSLPS